MIDLRSDTCSIQPKEMIESMFTAKASAGGYGEDSISLDLEKFASDLLGKEAAIFVPSGTFGNQVSLLTHLQKATERNVLVCEGSHILVKEIDSIELISKAKLNEIPLNRGEVDFKQFKNLLERVDVQLVCLENAHFTGFVQSIQNMEEIYRECSKRGIPIHLDGARVFNAALYLGVNVKDISKHVDSLMFCLTKGLCCPIGSLVLGSKRFIDKVRINMDIMGGAMTNTSYLAAAGLFALKNMIDRLKDDHDNAQLLSNELSKIPYIKIVYENQINMVFIDFNVIIDKFLFQKELENRGIKIKVTLSEPIRLMTHYGIGKDDIQYTIKCIKDIIGQCALTP